MRGATAIAALALWLTAVPLGTARPVGRGARMQRILQTPALPPDDQVSSHEGIRKMQTGPTPAPTRSRLEEALYVGDASNVTVEELRTALDAVADEVASVTATVAAIPWGQPAQNLSLTWDPSQDSIQLEISDIEHTAALFTTNHPSGSTKYILATAGYSVFGYGGRMAAFGANSLAMLWSANLNGTDFDVAMINVVRWLLGEDGSAVATAALAPRIVTAHLPTTFWCVASTVAEGLPALLS